MPPIKKPEFAANTTVPVEKSQADVRKMLLAYGASGILLGFNEGREVIAFVIDDLHIRFTFDTPRMEDYAVQKDGKPQGAIQSREAAEKAHRTVWREMHLNIKAKLVMATSKYRTVFEEFHADIVLPDGQTFSEWSRPMLTRLLADRKMPPLLPGIAPQALEE